MLTSIEGIYRDGKIELTESPPPDAAGRVIVTFVSSPVRPVNLAERGISPEQAADLRHRWRHLPKIGNGPKWMPTMPYSRGDVVLVFFPDSNQVTAKRRPRIGGAGRSAANRTCTDDRCHDHKQSVPGRTPKPGDGAAIVPARAPNGVALGFSGYDRQSGNGSGLRGLCV